MRLTFADPRFEGALEFESRSSGCHAADVRCGAHRTAPGAGRSPETQTAHLWHIIDFQPAPKLRHYSATCYDVKILNF
jgi:hypothetical protein